MSRRTLKRIAVVTGEAVMLVAIFAFTYGTARFIGHHGVASALAQCSR